MTSGGSSLGWALGAAVGASIGGEVVGREGIEAGVMKAEDIDEAIAAEAEPDIAKLARQQEDISGSGLTQKMKKETITEAKSKKIPPAKSRANANTNINVNPSISVNPSKPTSPTSPTSKPGSQRYGYELIVAIVGDGSFLFGVPSSAFWMARRYNTPFLTIIINNGGWKAPKLSLLGVYPSGMGSRVGGGRLSTGFQFPEQEGFGTGMGAGLPVGSDILGSSGAGGGGFIPSNQGQGHDYVQIASGASSGWVWGRRVGVPNPTTTTSASSPIGPASSSPSSSSFPQVAPPPSREELQKLISAKENPYNYATTSRGETINVGGGRDALEMLIREAVRVVREDGRCVVLDCLVDPV
jgi:hypothetical protein